MKKQSTSSRARKKAGAKPQPPITEKLVRSGADAKVFDRGVNYFESGAIIDPVRTGDLLFAYCAGSEYRPYRVLIRFNKKGIAEAACTCPYDWGGLCKHQVALLLTHIRAPESIKVCKPVAELLADWKKEELIGVIVEMVDRHPELYGLLDGTGIPEEDEFDDEYDEDNGYYDEW
jgi:uncharacterized Zn finger protein